VTIAVSIFLKVDYFSDFESRDDPVSSFNRHICIFKPRQSNKRHLSVNMPLEMKVDIKVDNLDQYKID